MCRSIFRRLQSSTVIFIAKFPPRTRKCEIEGWNSRNGTAANCRQIDSRGSRIDCIPCKKGREKKLQFIHTHARARAHVELLGVVFAVDTRRLEPLPTGACRYRTRACVYRAILCALLLSRIPNKRYIIRPYTRCAIRFPDCCSRRAGSARRAAPLRAHKHVI